MTNVKSASVKDFSITLPSQASDVYYRDEVGNVSTSNFRTSQLELRPRFPLFGGWIYSWNLGYNIPLRNYVKKFKEKYVLQIPLTQSIANAPIEDFVIKVILPEGSK